MLVGRYGRTASRRWPPDLVNVVEDVTGTPVKSLECLTEGCFIDRPVRWPAE